MELSLDGKVEAFELKPVASKKEYKMRKILLSSVIAGSMALALLNACADNSGETPMSASDTTGSTSSQDISIMDQPVDFSTPENVEISLQKVKDQEGEKAYKTLNSAMQYVLFYDLSLRNDKEKLYKALDGSTPKDIIARMNKR
jgi:hypothetical protein